MFRTVQPSPQFDHPPAEAEDVHDGPHVFVGVLIRILPFSLLASRFCGRLSVLRQFQVADNPVLHISNSTAASCAPTPPSTGRSKVGSP